ncbi:integrase [Nocardiopsis metallicus]|uniref:Integrase n=1 Tax=Nocardiopsis metallicus TaxID=179819 RepID=A0A840WLP3_9ACTN|nr:integrase [Nocardiopsis metallicus]
MVTCWAPLHPEATPHLTRHSHRSWLDEIGVPPGLADKRMGHFETAIPGTYKHPTETGRKRLREDLEELWEESLDERLWWSEWSLVAPLDQALKKREAGR